MNRFRAMSRSLAFALALVVALCGTALAQRQDGTLQGTVRDQSGAAVSNATVVVRNDATGVERRTTTSDVGFYAVPNLQIGTYTVTVEAQGFAPYTRSGVEVLAARVTEVVPQLSVGTGTEVVEVRSGAEVVQLESSQLSNTFTGRTITDIPAAAGAAASALQLSIFMPNTTTQPGGANGTGGSVGGLRPRQNGFTLDGVANNDFSVSTAAMDPIPDAVQEFTVATNIFSAEYGNASGGQFNVVTKSGTNNTHGSLWWYNVNRKLNAKDNQEENLIRLGERTDKLNFDFNRLGGQIGGPIISDRLFFFGAYQYQRQAQSPNAPQAAAPTAEGRTLASQLAANDAVRAILAQWPVASAADRNVTVNVGGTDHLIPVGPVIATAANFFTQHDYNINGDYNHGNHQLRTRYMKARFRQPTFGNFPQPQFTSNVSTDPQRATVGHVWSLSPRSVNDLRVGFNRLVASWPLEGVAATYPTVFVNELDGLFLGPANNFPQSSIRNTYQVADTFSYLFGRHSIRFGGEYRWFTGQSNFLQNSRGQHAYLGLNELVNDLVPGIANSTLQGVGSGAFEGNSRNFSLFVQDDLKLTPRLTVNLGLRYEFFGVPKGAHVQELNAVSDFPEAGLIFRVPGTDRNNFAPRLGFAWDPTGSSKWAIRGGAGVSYDTIPFNFYLNGAPPQKATVLQPPVACLGTLSAVPAWCATGQGYLANGAMNVDFIPPTTQAQARSLTGNLMADMISPTIYSWSLGVQRELMANTSMEVRYLGTRATGLPVQIQLNSITAFEHGAPTLPTYFSASEIPATVAGTAPNAQQVFELRGVGTMRRYGAQGFTDIITSFPAVGSSRYHGLAVDVNRRMARGLMARANWTWSKALDDSAQDLFTSNVNPRRPEDHYNLQGEWGRSSFDARHKFALTWVYDIPRLNVDTALARVLLHGWQYNGSYLWQTGTPITPQSGFDANGNGDAAGDRTVVNPNGTPRTGSDARLVCRDPGTGATSVGPTLSVAGAALTGGGGCPGGRQNIVGYVAANPDARYIRAGLGAVTDSGRNIENSDPFNNWNMSFFKNTAVGENKNLQFRVELYNVFNHRQFTLGNPSVFLTNTNALSTSYANVATTGFLNEKQFNGGSRTIQLGLRYEF